MVALRGLNSTAGAVFGGKSGHAWVREDGRARRTKQCGLAVTRAQGQSGAVVSGGTRGLPVIQAASARALGEKRDTDVGKAAAHRPEISDSWLGADPGNASTHSYS